MQPKSRFWPEREPCNKLLSNMIMILTETIWKNGKIVVQRLLVLSTEGRQQDNLHSHW